MALLGLSLILAVMLYVAVWKPSLLQTFLALWRGEPQIQQPPTTRRPSQSGSGTDEDQPIHTISPSSSLATQLSTRIQPDHAAMSPPPPVTQRPNGAMSSFKSQSMRSPPSPQTTPKVVPSTLLNGAGIPSFSLSSEPPASAAAVARITDANTSPAALPTLSAPSPPLQPPAPLPSTSTKTPMAPPRRPPALNNINNTGGTGSSSLLGVPSRGPLLNRQQHQYDRQPGTSTLAPPPTHSSKPAKPSRKVTLEPGRSPLDWARLANHPSSDLRNLGPGAPYLRVTPSMLRRQTGRKGKDAWTALGGRVYNITPYLPFHPGGEPELLRAAGRDGSKLFGEIHPWVNYETMLSSCLIGLLVEEHEAKSTGDMDAMD
ncbi:hypothetical protein GGR54DRAFT_610773 [Hypoxylon sp. NC1633]|nr:hypothetical protein GGR54DRAFT_610773 [Hypoxylon sp. NC1633]